MDMVFSNDCNFYLEENIELKKLENDLAQDRIRRLSSLSNLKFPYADLREGQKEMMKNILSSLLNNEALIIEAPTGIGKTLAALYPSLKALYKKKFSHIFYMTAKAYTREVVKNACQQLNSTLNNDQKFKFIILSPQDLLCPNHETNCQSLFSLKIKDQDSALQEALNEVLKNDFLNDENIKNCASRFDICPYKLQLLAMNFCEVIVGDYNHIFDPGSRLKLFCDDKNTKLCLLIDEAHNLVARSREMFTAVLDLHSLTELQSEYGIYLFDNDPLELIDSLNSLKKYFTALASQFKKMQINSYYLSSREKFCFAEIEESHDFDSMFFAENYIASRYLPKKLLDICRILSKKLQNFDKALNDNINHSNLKRFLKNLDFFIYIAHNSWDEAHILEGQRKENNIFLTLSPLDCAKSLYQALADKKNNEYAMLKHCPIFFSASLQPLSYYRTALCDLNKIPCQCLQIPSPFPNENLLILNTTYIKNDYQNRDFELNKIKDNIKVAIACKKANYMIYLPSYNYLKRLLYYIENDHFFRANFNIIIQKNIRDKKAEENFIKNFNLDFIKNKSAKPALGLAVLGGVFSEGIDLYGELLSGVIIIGLGLPQPNPYLEILKNYYELKTSQGFNYAYRYPGFNKILQAAGRVIRSMNDKGFVILTDSRFNSELYFQLWPKHFKPRPVQNINELHENIKNFWAN